MSQWGAVTRKGTKTVDVLLWERYSVRIYRYLRRLTGDGHLAEDLTQETFLQAMRDLRCRAVPPANPGAWLYRIATNRTTDHFRRAVCRE